LIFGGGVVLTPALRKSVDPFWMFGCAIHSPPSVVGRPEAPRRVEDGLVVGVDLFARLEDV
jgi:hypothetical protein